MLFYKTREAKVMLAFVFKLLDMRLGFLDFHSLGSLILELAKDSQANSHCSTAVFKLPHRKGL